MSTNAPQDSAASDIQEAAEEQELLKLEQEVEQMAQKILDYRTTLRDQLSSTLSSLLVSQRPVLPAHLVNQLNTRPESEARSSQGPMSETTATTATENSEEAEKIRLIKQKISSNTSALPVVLNRMKEYMARIDKLGPSNVIIHPAFKRKRAG